VRNVSFAGTGLRSFFPNDASSFARPALAVLATFILLAGFAQAALPDVPTAASIGAGSGRSSGKTPPCASTSIASVRAPTGPAAYQHGTLRLKNRASVWIEGSSTDSGVIQAVHMEPGDAVAACYGPAHRYADAGDARAITVLDLVTSGSYGNVVGSWPGAK
jgi:hypothetical protein